MKNIKYTIVTFAVSFIILSLFNSVIAHIASPPDRQSVEQEQLNRRYLYPMSGIKSILNSILRLCNRFPTQHEFKKFVLNGSHENIKCSEVIKTQTNPRDNLKFGKDIQELTQFFERNEHKAYSDTKKIFVILNIGPKEWKEKYFKSEDYAYVISCSFGTESCFLTPLELRANSCRASETFAKKHCHFNGKKIIDY